MWFMNKEVTLYKLNPEMVDEYGVSNDTGYSKIGTLMVDMQPYSTQKLQKDYGYDLECTKRMFANIDSNIEESNVIKYKNKYYSIQKIVDWDDYFDIMLLEKEDMEENE